MTEAEIALATWRPLDPAGEHELASLEQSTARGHCLEPALQAGDILYIDRRVQAQPGDIASFRLSQRGAAAQNSDLPAGQALWAAGATWCKLVQMAGPFVMLAERFGNRATATLMACEDPDDTPTLHPVRQIRRNGALLFTEAAPVALVAAPDLAADTADSASPQIGANAATTVASASLVSSIALGAVRNLASASITIPTGQTWNVAVNATANITLGTSPSGACNLQENGTTVQGPDGWGSGDAASNMNCPFTYITNLTAGTYTFTVTGVNTSGGATHNYSTVTIAVLKR